jgi:hypothetical protein
MPVGVVSGETEYFEEEPPLRGGVFTPWKRLFVDHLRDCYRQRRVFREAINDLRTEMLSETGRMHAENRERLKGLEEEIKDHSGKLEVKIDEGNRRLEAYQKWIMGGLLMGLVSLLAYFATHFGPLSVKL